VLHIGSHSFTPDLDGVARMADIGVLYDPARVLEQRFAALWLASLRARGAGVVRRNYPYQGRNDGLPTLLRRRFDPYDYLGLELEVNQRHPLGGARAWRQLQDAIVAALAEALAAFTRATPALTPPRVAPGSEPRSRAAAPPPGLRATTRAGR
jgi:predicted N-formylglutamate amidohydrolase